LHSNFRVDFTFLSNLFEVIQNLEDLKPI
jgi:hypothetical protein